MGNADSGCFGMDARLLFQEQPPLSPTCTLKNPSSCDRIYQWIKYYLNVTGRRKQRGKIRCKRTEKDVPGIL